jgi:4-hydroxy-tetrahydrodipicolinate synthase
MFTGCGTALVTPFRQDESLDEKTLRALVRRQIEEGINFLVPCGTTGESPTLEHSEYLRVVEVTREESGGRVPILAGAGGNSTKKVIALVKEMEGLGADGILSVTPYYNKPTQEGLFQHYKAISESTALPIVVYSVQARTGVNVEPATLARLAELKNIIGVKEASGNVSQMSRIAATLPDSFQILSGDDALTLPLIALGGCGLISVVANQIPGPMAKLAKAAIDGDGRTARQLQRKYQELMDVNFIESNPIPVKYGMSLMGLLEPVWRLPLTPPTAASKQKIEAVLASTGLMAGSARV